MSPQPQRPCSGNLFVRIEHTCHVALLLSCGPPPPRPPPRRRVSLWTSPHSRRRSSFSHRCRQGNFVAHSPCGEEPRLHFLCFCHPDNMHGIFASRDGCYLLPQRCGFARLGIRCFLISPRIGRRDFCCFHFQFFARNLALRNFTHTAPGLFWAQWWWRRYSISVSKSSSS